MYVTIFDTYGPKILINSCHSFFYMYNIMYNYFDDVICNAHAVWPINIWTGAAAGHLRARVRIIYFVVIILYMI